MDPCPRGQQASRVFCLFQAEKGFFNEAGGNGLVALGPSRPRFDTPAPNQQHQKKKPKNPSLLQPADIPHDFTETQSLRHPCQSIVM